MGEASLRGPVAVCVLLALAAGGYGCGRDEDKRGSPPPPVASSKPQACAGGGGKLTDAASAPFFPAQSGGYCLDPNGGDKAMGEQASLPIDKICDLFDGECEIYKGFGVRRVTELRYVDGAGSPATIDVHLSKFATSESAYAMFTKRVVGDGDPVVDSTPRPIEGGGAAALGLGNAYLWRGAYLVEITFNDETAAVAGVKAASDKLLPPLVKDIGGRLTGEATLPPAAAALPSDQRLPLGIRFITKDVLGVEGIGGGAFGYYKDGDRRWRVVSLVRADVDQAKDVLASFGKVAGAQREKGVGDGAVRLMHTEAGTAPAEWYVARSGKNVVGVGDEPRVLRTGMSADEQAKVTLPKDQKIALLKKLVGG